MRARVVRRHAAMPGYLTGLRISLTIGAARDVCTREQTARINADVMPQLLAPRWLVDGDPTGITDALTDVMGPEWEPAGIWAEQLAVLP